MMHELVTIYPRMEILSEYGNLVTGTGRDDLPRVPCPPSRVPQV